MLRVAGTFAVALLAATAAAATPPKATLATFAGEWWGHTRLLDVTRTGAAKEHIDDGCCYQVIDLRFQLESVSGTRSDATATFKVTAVKIYHRADRKFLHDPHVGELGRLHLRKGIVTESVTGTTYCAPKVDACGA